MTTANNSALQPILPGVINLPCIQNAATNINAGDLVFWDAGGVLGVGKYTLGAITTDAQAGSSIGVSQDSQPINSQLTANIGGTSNVYKLPDYLVVNFNSVFRFNSTAGDTYNWFDALYIGADSQTLTNTAGAKTNILARVFFPPSDENGNSLVNTWPVSGGTGVIVRGIVKPLYANLGIL